MELNINSPAYFSQYYGIDDEVYRFCQKAYHFFHSREYNDTLHIIGITPAIAPEELYAQGQWKESIRLIDNKHCAIITIRMNFDQYYQADSHERILLIQSAVLNAVKKISARSGFNFAQFEEDFHQIL